MVSASSGGQVVDITKDFTDSMSNRDMVKCTGAMEASTEVNGTAVFRMDSES